jgi:choline dehydrogenase
VGNPRCWRDAAEQCGIPKVDEFNRGDNFGNAYFQMNQRGGRRWEREQGVAAAGAGPPEPRPRHEGAREADRHRGARRREARDRRRARDRRARRGRRPCAQGVILAAGSIGSPAAPAALRRRPRTLLQSFGIPVVHELAGVGENLQDHLQIRMVWKVKGPTLNERAATSGERRGWDSST